VTRFATHAVRAVPYFPIEDEAVADPSSKGQHTERINVVRPSCVGLLGLRGGFCLKVPNDWNGCENFATK
jgi:hypothetical protein